MPTATQRFNRKLWIQALRSGEFAQGVGYLNSGDTYCCLGVACEVLGFEKQPNSEGIGYVLYFRNYTSTYPGDDIATASLPAEDFAAMFGVSLGKATRMTEAGITMNDNEGKTFPQIARYMATQFRKGR